MRRYVDTFFRYWGLIILPVLILPLGYAVLMKSAPVDYGTADIWVDQTSLQQLSYVDQGVPPATNMTNYVDQLLLTRSFDLRVAQRSPLYWQALSRWPNPADLAEADLSKYATATATGPNLVTIAYTSKNPVVAVQVVQAILNETSSEISSLNQQQANKSIAHYSSQLASARSRYDSASQALGTYMSSHGISAAQIAVQGLADPKLAGLYQAVQLAQTQVTNAQQQLSAAQAQEAAPSAFRVIDAPAAKVTTTSKKKELTALAIPLVLGLLLSGAFLVIRTALDKSLRYADEVPDLLALPVLTVVPYAPALAGASTGRRGLRRTRAGGEG